MSLFFHQGWLPRKKISKGSQREKWNQNIPFPLEATDTKMRSGGTVSLSAQLLVATSEDFSLGF